MQHRTRFRFTLKENSLPDAPVLWEGVIWAHEQMQSNAPGGVVLVYEKPENPEITALYEKHGTLVASWVPIA